MISLQSNTFTREIMQVSMHCDTVLLNLCKNKKLPNVVLPLKWTIDYIIYTFYNLYTVYVIKSYNVNILTRLRYIFLFKLFSII